eukprot:scaffold167142_cov30-Tisochrysis_lutea.AAC.2
MGGRRFARRDGGHVSIRGGRDWVEKTLVVREAHFLSWDRGGEISPRLSPRANPKQGKNSIKMRGLIPTLPLGTAFAPAHYVIILSLYIALYSVRSRSVERRPCKFSLYAFSYYAFKYNGSKGQGVPPGSPAYAASMEFPRGKGVRTACT